MNSRQKDSSDLSGPRRQPPFRSRFHNRAGFTVVELLALLVVLGLMASMLLSTVASTRPNGASFQCANNLRQLVAAWKMYAEDNRGKLVYNIDGPSAGKAAGSESWVGGWLDCSTSTSDNTNVDLLINHERNPYGAFLGPYVKIPAVFKCPADKGMAMVLGRPAPRVRSVSLNSLMGQNARTWVTGSRYTVYTKAAQIQSPDKLFVFLDERQDSINDGCFLVNPDTRYNLVDFPASYHNRAGAFGFADGHFEMHRWQDPRTMPPPRPGVALQLNVNLAVDADVDWIQQHASVASSGL